MPEVLWTGFQGRNSILRNSSLKQKKAVKRNVFLGIDICNKLDKKGMMYTDMSMSEIAYVISEVLKYDFSFDEIKTISGKIKYGK